MNNLDGDYLVLGFLIVLFILGLLAIVILAPRRIRLRRMK
jgi:hypothetical protein